MAHQPDGLSRFRPLAQPCLTNPRLTLTPLADGDLAEALDVIVTGIDDPDVMPFGVP